MLPKPNDKAVFCHPNSGYTCDQRLADKYLKEGEVYTIKEVEVDRFFTDIYLEEVPGVRFNSVLFDIIVNDTAQVSPLS